MLLKNFSLSGLVVHTFNTSTQEEAGRSLSLMPSWSTYSAVGQPGLHGWDPVSKEKKIFFLAEESIKRLFLPLIRIVQASLINNSVVWISQLLFCMLHCFIIYIYCMFMDIKYIQFVLQNIPRTISDVMLFFPKYFQV